MHLRGPLTGWNGLLDLLGSDASVDLERDQILGRSQLELRDIALLVFLDGDLLGLWQVLALFVLHAAHDLNEVLQIFDFLWLQYETNN